MTANVPCPRGHELQATTLGSMREQYGGVYASGFQCDVCHAEYAASDVAVAHCPSCEYDLCYSCANVARNKLMCGSGHALLSTTHEKRVGETHDYNPGYYCDQCRAGPLQGASRHCTFCRYDLCSNCVHRRLGYPAIEPQYPMPPQPQPHPPPLMGAPPMPQPPRPHMAGFVGPIVRPPVAPAGLSNEWRRVFESAGLCADALDNYSAKAVVFAEVATMAGRPMPLNEPLPPLSSIPRSPDAIAAALREAWRRYTASRPPDHNVMCAR
eukprot:m51a1_g12475 hypothetical protein (268) ;mRNA; f:1889-3191